MADGELLWLVCYDVERNGDRARLADMLAAHLVRVQRSVFEGWLTTAAARRIGAAARRHLGPEDSLRIYAIGKAGLRRSFVFGPAPLPEPENYYLL